MLTASEDGLLDAERASPSTDEYFIALGRKLDTFAGLYYANERGTPVVRLTDLSDAERARPIIGAVLDTYRARVSLPEASAEFVTYEKADYTFLQLKAWQIALRPLVLGIPGVVYLDADELRNRVVVAVADDSAEASVWELAASTPVPGDAIQVVRSGPVVNMGTSQDKYRPLMGGLKIFSPQSLQNCTMATPARHFDGTTQHRGFLTASHCASPVGVEGGQLGYHFFQPDDGVCFFFCTNQVGTVTVNPPYFQSLQGCPAGRYCRWSDSAFVELDDQGSYTPQLLVDFRTECSLPTKYCTQDGTLNSAPLIWIPPAYHRVVGWTSAWTSPYSEPPPWGVGWVVYKMGMRTGQTVGTVTASCVDINKDNMPYTLLCQGKMAGGVHEGDSGSGVFARNDPSNLDDNYFLDGILWGGNATDDEFWVSPDSQVGFEIPFDLIN